jgi:hypothetical protein
VDGLLARSDIGHRRKHLEKGVSAEARALRVELTETASSRGRYFGDRLPPKARVQRGATFETDRAGGGRRFGTSTSHRPQSRRSRGGGDVSRDHPGSRPEAGGATFEDPDLPAPPAASPQNRRLGATFRRAKPGSRDPATAKPQVTGGRRFGGPKPNARSEAARPVAPDHGLIPRSGRAS